MYTLWIFSPPGLIIFYIHIYIYTYYTYIYKYLHTYIHIYIYTYIYKRKRAILGGGRPPIQVQSCAVSFAPGAMHPAFVQMYRAEVTDVLARRCPAMSSEMAHFALMKCNKIKHACLEQGWYGVHTDKSLLTSQGRA